MTKPVYRGMQYTGVGWTMVSGTRPAAGDLILRLHTIYGPSSFTAAGNSSDDESSTYSGYFGVQVAFSAGATIVDSDSAAAATVNVAGPISLDSAQPADEYHVWMMAHNNAWYSTTTVAGLWATPGAPAITQVYPLLLGDFISYGGGLWVGTTPTNGQENGGWIATDNDDFTAVGIKAAGWTVRGAGGGPSFNPSTGQQAAF